MSDPVTTEVQSVQTLRRRRREEGRIFWNDENQLGTNDQLEGTKETDTLLLGRNFGILRSQ